MNELPKYYTILFNAVTDSLEALYKGDTLGGISLLVMGKHNAEEAISSGKLPEYYKVLSCAAADALEVLYKDDALRGISLLVLGQRNAEEAYISEVNKQLLSVDFPKKQAE